MTEEWAIVELMGHVRIAGRVSEEERFGSKIGRIDIPQPAAPSCPACKGAGLIAESRSTGPDGVEAVSPAHACRMPNCNRYVTQFFGGGSVYRITLVSEDVARHVAKSSDARPAGTWDLPRLGAPSEQRGLDYDGDYGDGD